MCYRTERIKIIGSCVRQNHPYMSRKKHESCTYMRKSAEKGVPLGIFLRKYLVISKKSSNFAFAFASGSMFG